MPYNNDSSSFQAILQFQNSAEVVGKIGDSQEIVLHFDHRCRCRLELMLQLNSEKNVTKACFNELES